MDVAVEDSALLVLGEASIGTALLDVFVAFSAEVTLALVALADVIFAELLRVLVIFADVAFLAVAFADVIFVVVTFVAVMFVAVAFLAVIFADVASFAVAFIGMLEVLLTGMLLVLFSGAVTFSDVALAAGIISGVILPCVVATLDEAVSLDLFEA